MTTTSSEHVVPVGTVKQVALKDIKVPERFRKDYGDMEAFCESIREKGILQPITLSNDLTLLAGGRRFKAATDIGLDKVPALVRKVASDELDNREIELIENTFRKDFTWQEEAAIISDIDRLYKERNLNWSGRKTAELLNKSPMNVSRKLELADAIAQLPDLALLPTASDAYKILKQLEEKVVTTELAKRQEAAYKAEDADNPAVAAAEATGTLYTGTGYTPELKQRLRTADSNYRVGDVFAGLAELRNDGPVHFIECDPPYGIELAKVKGSKDAVDSNVHSYNEVPKESYVEFLNKLTKELYRVAGRDAWLVFWFGPTWHTEVRDALRNANWHVDDIPAIWTKNQGQTLQPEVYLARTYEPFFVCRKGQPALIARGRSNVFPCPGEVGVAKYHPTQRPVHLIIEILATFTMPGQTILVPFLGSGATLRAAYQRKCNAFGWDLNDEYKAKFMLAVEDDFKYQQPQQELTT